MIPRHLLFTEREAMLLRKACGHQLAFGDWPQDDLDDAALLATEFYERERNFNTMHAYMKDISFDDLQLPALLQDRLRKIGCENGADIFVLAQRDATTLSAVAGAHGVKEYELLKLLTDLNDEKEALAMYPTRQPRQHLIPWQQGKMVTVNEVRKAMKVAELTEIEGTLLVATDPEQSNEKQSEETSQDETAGAPPPSGDSEQPPQDEPKGKKKKS